MAKYPQEDVSEEESSDDETENKRGDICRKSKSCNENDKYGNENSISGEKITKKTFNENAKSKNNNSLNEWKNLHSVNDIDNVGGKNVAKEIGKFVLKTGAISAAIIGGTALIVPAIGFGTLGVTAGSAAAAYQSAFLGGTIASGSLFATLQSIGMAGLSVAAKGLIVAGSAATSGVHSIFKLAKDKEK